MLACSWRLQRLFAFETATVGGDQGEAGRGCLGFIKFCARAKFGRADEANIAGRAAKCAASGAFAAKVDDAPSAREAPHPQGRARKATGRARRAAANKEPAWANSSLARDLTTMTKAKTCAPGGRQMPHMCYRCQGGVAQALVTERSIALPPRCGGTGANRRTCLIWPARELSVSAVPARGWAFLRQRRSGRELSLSNTKVASLRPSRPIT